MSFTFYVLSRFKYCPLLVKNSTANRNFPGWCAGADEGHSLKPFLPWEENLEGCCLSNLYQAQQVVRCLCCKSAMIPIPQPCGYHGRNQLQKPISERSSEVCMFFSMCWADIGTCTEQQGSRKGALQRLTTHTIVLKSKLSVLEGETWLWREKKTNLQVGKHSFWLVFEWEFFSWFWLKK